MSNDNSHDVISISDGDLKVWIDQEAIHIKTCDSYGDPVELTPEQARQLAQILQRLAERIGD